MQNINCNKGSHYFEIPFYPQAQKMKKSSTLKELIEQIVKVMSMDFKKRPEDWTLRYSDSDI